MGIESLKNAGWFSRERIQIDLEYTAEDISALKRMERLILKSGTKHYLVYIRGSKLPKVVTSDDLMIRELPRRFNYRGN